MAVSRPDRSNWHDSDGCVSITPQQTHTRTFSGCARSHARCDHPFGSRASRFVCVCASKSHFIIGHVFVECSFDPAFFFFSSPTPSLTSSAASPTPLTGIRCATPLWGGPSGHLARPIPNTVDARTGSVAQWNRACDKRFYNSCFGSQIEVQHCTGYRQRFRGPFHLSHPCQPCGCCAQHPCGECTTLPRGVPLGGTRVPRSLRELFRTIPLRHRSTLPTPQSHNSLCSPLCTLTLHFVLRHIEVLELSGRGPRHGARRV